MYLTRLKKRKIAELLFTAGMIITAIQGFLASSHIPTVSDSSMAIVMGLISIISALITTFYQYLHDSVPSKVAISGLIISFISILGGLNEWIKLIHINGQYGIAITFTISLCSAILQMASKVFYVPNKDSSK
jgi:hypothetical protein